MALNDTVQGIENPLTGVPTIAPDDLEQVAREARNIEDLKKIIDEAIRLIDSSDLPDDEKRTQRSRLEGLKNGLTGAMDLVAARARVSEAVGAANFAFTSNTIYNSLSAASQAAVNARVNALSEGRFADYYFDTFDPENKLDANTRAFVAERIENNPEIQANAKASQALGRKQLTEIEATHENDRNFVRDRLAATTGQEHEMWQRVSNLRLMRLPGYSEQLRNASPSEMAGIVKAAVTERVKLAQPILEQFPANSPAGRYLRQLGDTDGYGNPDVIRLLELGNSRAGHEALTALAKVNGDYSQLPEAQRPLAAAADFAQKANANYGHQSNILQALKNMSHAKEGEVGHGEHFNEILDKKAPLNQRINTLANELAEHGDESIKNLSLAARRDMARQFIREVDRLGNPREALFAQSLDGLTAQELNARFTQQTQRSQLEQAGFTPEQVRTLEGLATEPALQSTLASALRVLNPNPNNDRHSPEQKATTRQQLVNATTIATNPEYQDALSKIRYYNLTNSDAGHSALLNILSGKLEPSAAAQVVNALQQQTIGHMQPFAAHVPTMLNPDYQSVERLTRLGMFEGTPPTLNVERLIETARINRDTLGGSDAAIAARSKIAWADLGNGVSAEEGERRRDARVVAQAAIRFKAIEAVQAFGERLAEVTDRVGGNVALSEAFTNDKKLFEQLNDNSNPEAQKQALNTILKSQQYLRVNDKLRTEVTNNMAALLASGSLVFGEQRTASATAPSTPVSEPLGNPMVTPAPSAPDLMREQAFDTSAKIDSREQQGSSGLDNLSKSDLEKSILAAVQNLSPETRQQIFGSLLGSFNEVDSNFISYNEIENAVRAADKTKNSNEILAAFDSDDSGLLSLNEITTYLANAGVSGGQGVASNGAPPTQVVPNAQVNAGQTTPPVTGR